MDEEAWQSMTLSQRRIALEEPGRQVLGQSERNVTTSVYERASKKPKSWQRKYVLVKSQETEGRVRRRNSGESVDPGTQTQLNKGQDAIRVSSVKENPEKYSEKDVRDTAYDQSMWSPRHNKSSEEGKCGARAAVNPAR